MALVYENTFATGDFSTSRINSTLAGETTIITGSPTPREGANAARVQCLGTEVNLSNVHRTQRVWGANFGLIPFERDALFEYWLGFSFYAPASYPSSFDSSWEGSDGNAILWQINGGPGSGGPELDIRSVLPGNTLRWFGAAPNLPTGLPFPRDRWVDVVVALVRSASGSGRTRIWIDGQIIYSQNNISNTWTSEYGSNVTYGIYWGTQMRPGWDATIYWDSLRAYVATPGEDHYADVAPTGSEPPPDNLAPPVFDPPATLFDTSIVVSLSSPDDPDEIYWTGDGSDPDSSDNAYSSSGPITLTSTSTIKAIAVKSGFTDSAISEATYTLAGATDLLAPVIDPPGGDFETEVEVTISSAQSPDTIYYTLDGSDPDTGSTEYTGPFPLTATTTVKTYCVKSGWTDSPIASADFTLIDLIPPPYVPRPSKPTGIILFD